MQTIRDAEGRPELAPLGHLRRGAGPRRDHAALRGHLGDPGVEGYGLTEATCVSPIIPREGARKVGSIGLPIPGHEVAILDGKDCRRRAGRDQHARPPLVGYWSRPESPLGPAQRLAAHRRRRLWTTTALSTSSTAEGHDDPAARTSTRPRSRTAARIPRRRCARRSACRRRSGAKCRWPWWWLKKGTTWSRPNCWPWWKSAWPPSRLPKAAVVVAESRAIPAAYFFSKRVLREQYLDKVRAPE